MSDHFTDFPPTRVVYPGCVLASVVHAIMITRYPDLSYEHSWDGLNYCSQDSMGSRGTIAFSKGGFVAAVFDANSPRNPFRSLQPFDVNGYFKSLPVVLRPLAFDEALQYLLQEYDGSQTGVITAAFWSGNERVAAAENWSLVYENGGHLFRKQLMGIEEGLEEWRSGWEMSDQEVQLALSIFDKRISAGPAVIELGANEREALLSSAVSEEAGELCRELLKEIGILML